MFYIKQTEILTLTYKVVFTLYEVEGIIRLRFLIVERLYNNLFIFFGIFVMEKNCMDFYGEESKSSLTFNLK